MFSKLPALTRRNILVFYFNLGDFIANIKSFYDLLSEDEKEKAQRLLIEKDRTQYVLARGVLRVLLGHYVNVLPASVAFSYHLYGKPYLKDFPATQFNVSHSKERVVIALNYEDLIGVDIEYMARAIDADGIAKSFFNDKEYLRLLNLDKTQKRRLFFYQWAAKEAFVKAIGRGLSFSLADIEIALNAQEEVRIAATKDARENPRDWTLYALNHIPEYAAVVAVRAKSKILIEKDLSNAALIKL